MQIARIYQSLDNPSGYRILVDRIWPRGISKQKAHLDIWFRDIAPSTELRKWFGHIPDRYDEFHAKYFNELDKNPKTKELLELVKQHPDAILLYSAKDQKHNQAVVLKDYINQRT